MLPQSESRGVIFFLLTALLFVLACSISNPSPNNPPAFDPTKAVLEFQATTVSMQLTQAAANIPSQPAPVQPTNPPEPTTLINTVSPQPTVEANVTEVPSDVAADVQDYYLKGYLPFQNGQLYVLDDFSKKSLSVDVFDFTRTRQQVQDFALWADVELDSRGSTTYPNYTGCGFAYRVQNNSEGYTAILTNDAVRMGSCKGGMSQCELFGTTFGSGEVNVQNKTKTQFSLVVNKHKAYVLVDGILVGQYTLFTTKLLGMGEIYYGVVSNLNAGYWTSCQISNVRVWESNP